jgi:hypothetical protein
MKIITTEKIREAYAEINTVDEIINSFVKNNVIENLTKLNSILNTRKFNLISPTSKVKKNGK